MVNAGWTGRIIDGRYAVESVIGAGGMGLVLKARHKFTGADVALKVLRPELELDTEVQMRFLAEARAPTAIGHPGIVAVIDAGKAPDGLLYLVMELLIGQPLRVPLSRGELAAGDMRRVLLELLDVLGVAHARGFVHRDLKPENVFLTAPANTVKLLDFGIAKVLDAGIAKVRTATGATLGTPAYMAPEQFHDPSGVDARADLWAVGVMAFEMLAGRLPYGANTTQAMLIAIATKEPDPIRAHVPNAPPALEAFFSRALCRDRNARFSSAAEMAQALAGLPIGSAVAPAPKQRATPMPAPSGPGGPAGPGMTMATGAASFVSAPTAASAPGTPHAHGAPHVHGAPAMPHAQGAPQVQGTPGTPHVQGTPGMPYAPGMPHVQGTPGTQHAQGMPHAPGTPHAPTPAGVPGMGTGTGTGTGPGAPAMGMGTGAGTGAGPGWSTPAPNTPGSMGVGGPPVASAPSMVQPAPGVAAPAHGASKKAWVIGLGLATLVSIGGIVVAVVATRKSGGTSAGSGSAIVPDAAVVAVVTSIDAPTAEPHIEPDASTPPDASATTTEESEGLKDEDPPEGAQSALELCTAGCRASKAKCGALNTCIADCVGNPAIRACLEKPIKNCNELAICGMRAVCGADVLRGNGTCYAAATCQNSKCLLGDIQCGCDCANTMAQRHAHALASLDACALNCKFETQCMQNKCALVAQTCGGQ